MTHHTIKQWGGVWKKRTGRELDGRTWDQMPRERHHHPASAHFPAVPSAST
jgi:protein gp37